jgi:hypothetical protein
MSTPSLDAAITSLGEREGIPEEYVKKSIGRWQGEKSDDPICTTIGKWAKKMQIDAVVWTNLSAKFGGKKNVPLVDEIVRHLDNLPHEKRHVAEEYVRRTPLQIDTEYRRAIEKALGWPPIGANSTDMNRTRTNE